MADKNSRLNLLSSQQSQKEVAANSLFNAMSPAAFGGMNPNSTSGLIWGVYGGANGTNIVSNTTVTLNDNTTNYLHFNTTDNTFSVATSINTSLKLLYSIVTSNGQATSWSDYRPSAVTASGGGGTTLLIATENTPTPKPTATGQGAVSIGAGSKATGDNSIAAMVGDSLYGATGFNSIAFGYQTVAATTGSIVISYTSQILNGSTRSSIFGGQNNYVDGASNSSVISATDSKATAASYAFIFGGKSNILSSYYSAIINGYNVNSGTDAIYSTTFGYNAKPVLPGTFCIGFGSKSQFQKLGMSGQTTTNTATALQLIDGFGNQKNIVIPTNTASVLRVNVIALGSGGNSAGFNLDAVIKNVSGTHSIVNSSVVNMLNFNKIAYDMAAMAWNATLVLDNNTIKINVVGSSTTTVQWTAVIDAFQVYL